MERTYLRIFMKSLWLRYNRLDIHIRISLFHCWILSMCYDKAHQLLVQTRCLNHLSEFSWNCLFSKHGEIDAFTWHQFLKELLLSVNVFLCVLTNHKNGKKWRLPESLFFIWPTTKITRKLFSKSWALYMLE